MVRIFVLLLLFQLQLWAHVACYSYYPDKTKANINKNSQAVQIFRNNGFIFKILKLSELNENSLEYKKAHDYLDRQYPEALSKGPKFKSAIIDSNKKLWSQMHLLLVYHDQNLENPIAGTAYISSRTPSEKLGFEDELGVNYLQILKKEFQPVTEVGRLSVDAGYANKRKVLDALLNSLYTIYSVSTDYKHVYIYTSRKLHQLYNIKGLVFDIIPELSSPELIGEEDVIAVFRNKK